MASHSGRFSVRGLLVDGGRALLRCAALAGVALAGLVLLVLLVVSGSLVGLGVGLVLLPVVVAGVRGLTNRVRRSARRWSGVPIASPYRSAPDGLTVAGRCTHLLGDRANWRDALWLLVDATAGVLITAAPVLLFLDGVRGLLMPVLVATDTLDALGDWYAGVTVTDQRTAGFAVLIGLAQLPIALWLAPLALRVHARLAAGLLSPSQVERLTTRVQHLAETREDVLGSQVDELRRIERNLHDGAQARLVAMGMTLDAAMTVMTRDPEAARALVGEAKSSSAQALHELRDLVRGLQPPVLVDRGLADAVRTLAIESPLQIETTIDLPHRPSAVIESAAYFTVSELLTNAAKHSGARTGAIDVRHRDGLLSITVHDDGHGGADLALGTGLRGVARRLAALDGGLTVVSPVGGPTDVTVEIPCGPDAALRD